MTKLTKTFHLITAILVAFGFYYLVGWFISNEPNMFAWTFWGKVVYMVLSGLLVVRLLDGFFGWEYKDKNTE